VENHVEVKALVSLELDYGIDAAGSAERTAIEYIKSLIVKNVALRLYMQYSSM
jgi:hypothetical protein